MRERSGPFPQPFWRQRVAANVQDALQVSLSGEFTAQRAGLPLGAVRFGGEVTNVWLSVESTGAYATTTLLITGEVRINGVSCLSTRPGIGYVSGGAAQKDTKASGSGITQAVVNHSANTVSPGDVLTAEFFITRTATPTSEIKNPTIVVEIEPK